MSKVKKNEILLDPFCGSGTISQEALLKGINVIGTDSDSESIKQANNNLNWLVKKYNITNKFELKQLDCRKLANNLKNVDGVVTEPYMGPYIRKLPNIEEAKKLVLELSRLYNDLLSNLKNIVKKNGMVVIVIPIFKTRENKNVFLDFRSIIDRNGFVLVTKPITYGYRENKLLREIYILEKE